MAYDYAQTHDRILQSAGSHFAAKGFSGASIRQICQDAGVTNGAFYAHFRSKENLFEEIVGSVVEGMQSLYDGENAAYMDIHSAGDIRKVMEQTFSSNRLLIHYLYEHGEVFRLLLSAGAGTKYENFTEKLAREEADATTEFIRRCSAYLENAKEVPEGLVKGVSQMIIFTVMDGFLAGRQEEDVIREAELASEFCLAGMYHFMGI